MRDHLQNGANQRLLHIDSIEALVNVTSENYNMKLIFSSRYYSNDVYTMIQIQNSSHKQNGENDKLVLRSFPLKFRWEKHWEQDYRERLFTGI